MQESDYTGAATALARVATALAVVVGSATIAVSAGAQEASVEHEHAAGAEMEADRRARSAAPSIADFEVPTTDSMLRVVDHPDEDELEIVLGPVSLPAGLPHVRTPIQMAEWPFDGWMHGFSWSVRDAEGNRLPDELLHHVNLIDPDRRQLFSPIARRLAAAGRETPSVSLPSLVGVPLSQGTRMLVVGMFANPTDQSYDEAYLHIDLDYTRQEVAVLPRLDVYPFYLDVMGPVGDRSFPVPPGRTEVSWEGSPAVDARMLGVGGHLHDYAVELRLEDVTTGETLWRTEPVTAGEDGHRVVSVEPDHLWWKGGVKVEADHTYRATVVYENPTDEPAPHGGMGVIAGVVHTSEREWPGFDRQDPTYLADLWNTVTAPERSLAAGEGHEHGAGGMHGAVPGSIVDPDEIVLDDSDEVEGGGRR
ncbi:MAG: hypothetical protein ACOC83_00995 [Gemmatimonadota bacterium]